MNWTEKELLLFDLDGTLIDSVPDLALAINEMLAELERKSFTEETIRYWVGNGAQVLVKRALSGSKEIDKPIDGALFDSAMKIFLAHYSQHLYASTKPYPGVTETLGTLKESGYRLAIVTNKPIEFVEPILRGLKLHNYFEYYIGGNSLEKKKPDPLPLLHSCKKMKITTEAAVMVGDSSNDILAARAAGIQSIGVTYGYNYGEDIAVYSPDIIVDHFPEVLSVFDRRKQEE